MRLEYLKLTRLRGYEAQLWESKPRVGAHLTHETLEGLLMLVLKIADIEPDSLQRIDELFAELAFKERESNRKTITVL